jgi:inner membrane protein
LDNFTHTLVGLLVGEAASQRAGTVQGRLPPGTHRTLLISTLVIGSNLPDIDIAYSGLDAGRLGYLLQHRGYTHTVVGALVAAALMYGACELWLRWRRLVPSRAERLWLLAAALTGPLLHLAMDFTNSYGVHPFWPFYDGWLYGDSVFIVEPLLWAAAAPLVFQLRTRAARAFVAAVLALGIVLAFVTRLMPPASILLFIALTAAMLLVGRLMQPRTALAVGITVWLAVTGIFALAGRAAATQLESYALSRFPRAAAVDQVLTPMPADPVCWEALLIQLEGDTYVVRRATLSLAPHWLHAAHCSALNFAPPTVVPLHAVADPGSDGLAWRGEFSMPRADLVRLAATNCEAAAFLRFARAPWAAEDPGHWLLGDLRFGGRGVATLQLSAPARCPRFVPPWLPPRADVIGIRQ